MPKDAEAVIGESVRADNRFAYPGFRHLHRPRAPGTRRQELPNRKEDEDQGQQDRRLQARPDPARQPLEMFFASLKTKRAATHGPEALGRHGRFAGEDKTVDVAIALEGVYDLPKRGHDDDC